MKMIVRKLQHLAYQLNPQQTRLLLTLATIFIVFTTNSPEGPGGGGFK